MAFIKMSSFKRVTKLQGDEDVIGLGVGNIKFSIQLLKSFFTSISQLATKPTINPTDIVGISDSDGNIIYKTTIKDLVLNSGVSFDNDNFKGSFVFDDAAPLNPDNKAIWGFASNPTDDEQIFVNFGNTPVPANSIGVMSYNGTQWKFQKIEIDLSGYTKSGGYLGTSQDLYLLVEEKIGVDDFTIVGENLVSDGEILDNKSISSGGAIQSATGYNSIRLILAPEITEIVIDGLDLTAVGVNDYYTFEDGENFGIILEQPIVIQRPSGTNTIVFQYKKPSQPENVINELIVQSGNKIVDYGISKLRNIPILQVGYTKEEIDALLPQFTLKTIPGTSVYNPETDFVPDRIVGSTAPYKISGAPGWGGIVLPMVPGQRLYISGWDSARQELNVYKGEKPTGEQIRTAAVGDFDAQYSRHLYLAKNDGRVYVDAAADETWVFLTVKNATETDDVWANFQAGSVENPSPDKTFVQKINDNDIVSDSLVDSDGNIHSYNDIKEEIDAAGNTGGMKVTLNTSVTNIGAVLEHEIDGHQIKTVLAPFRPLSPDASSVFDYRGLYIDGINIHPQGDDVAPIRMSTTPGGATTTIAANHGVTKGRIVKTGHGKQFVDVGSIWTDGTTQFVIFGIISANILDIRDRNALGTHMIGTTLTHVSGATNTSSIDASNITYIQGYPVFKNHQIRVYADGVLMQNEDSEFYVKDHIIFAESYDILDSKSVMDWLVSQVGTPTQILQFDGSVIDNFSASYMFSPFYIGSVIFNQQIALVDGLGLQDWMGVMGLALAEAAPFTNRRFYIPKTLPFTWDGTPFDFSQPTPLSGTHTTRADFTPDKTLSTGILADRVIQLLDHPDFEGAGIAIGFAPLLDAGNNRRVNAARKAFQISESNKTYMSLIDSVAIDTFNKGDVFSAICYKIYFIRQGQRTSQYNYPSRDNYYLYLDWNTDIIDTYALPDHLQGKEFEVVEKSDNVNLLSKFATSSLMMDVTANGSYGYLILKFNK